MAISSASYHEPLEKLSVKTRQMHQALVSLQEELEAVDWYRQRADACSDPELKEILLHNMREEIEHACMVLEWLRRNDADFASEIKTYLFSDVPILAAEEGHADDGPPAAKPRSPYRFTVGDLKG